MDELYIYLIVLALTISLGIYVLYKFIITSIIDESTRKKLQRLTDMSSSPNLEEFEEVPYADRKYPKDSATKKVFDRNYRTPS